METLIRLLVVAALAYVAFCALLFFMQGRMIFFPRPLERPPAGPDVVPVELHADEASLRGWIVNPEGSGVVVVYFGGNAEEVSHLVPVFRSLAGTGVLVNYRGYGESEGTPSASALIADASLVVERVRERFPGREVAIVGRSLGSGIAARAAAAAGVRKLVLISPYRSIADIASSRFPFVPVRWLLRHNIDAAAVVPQLPRGVLVIHALGDRVVPTAESQALAALLDAPEIVIWDGPHSVPLTTPAIWPTMQAYLERAGKPAGDGVESAVDAEGVPQLPGGGEA